ncbi:hypothetical protein LSAT2_021476 [Lamellibrachia satsuma]|nr:hypothetical protein LSAT2_021476 [Lamellibrachia satsuma]
MREYNLQRSRHPSTWTIIPFAGPDLPRLVIDTERTKMEGSRRQYLRPWLEQILNEARVPGVEWIDKGAQTFKIPWKRNGDASARPEDFQIFREWACHTGRECEDKGNSTVYTKWKTRLRCALHKAPDIQEEKSLHQTDPSMDEPYKTYKFLRTLSAHGHCSPDPRQSPSSFDDSQDSPYTPRSEIPDVVDEFNPPDEAQKFPSDLEAMSRSGLVTGLSGLSMSEAINSKNEVEDIDVPTQCAPPQMEPRAAQAAVATVVPLPVPAPSGMPEQVMTAVLEDMSMSINSDCILSATGFAQGAVAATDGHLLKLQIVYCCETVKEETVQKCCVHYGEAALPPELLSEGCGSQDVHKVDMPSLEVIRHMPVEKYIQKLQSLLNNLQRGFIVDCDNNGDIYVTRYCQVIVFAESTNSMEIQKLNREERTKVFDQKTFERQLTHFNSETAKKPSSEVLLVIGQQPRNDRSKYLMYVTVASSKASSQLEQLPSPTATLQMSVSDEFDRLYKFSTANNTQYESMDTG